MGSLRSRRIPALPAVAVFAVILSGCVTPLPTPGEVRVPTPIEGNSGEYMAPYTQDRVVAKWVDKAINAKLGATIGRVAGTLVAQKLLENVPIFGGWLGGKAGEMIGRKIALEASGGVEYIKENSDLSFNSVDDLAVWLYAEYSTNEHYQEVLSATWEIYPELKTRYAPAIHAAKK